jgi:hypothetical protein
MIKIMRNGLLFFAVLFFSSCSLFKSDIKEIDSIVLAREALSNATQQTLVVFDMDDTLMAPTEKMFWLPYRSFSDFCVSDLLFLIKFYADALIVSIKDSECMKTLISEVFSKTNFVPLEPKTIELIKNLQARKVKVIALTASNTNKFGVIENMQKWRLADLNQIGLDFSGSFEKQEIVFDTLQPQFGSYPMFYKGILCSARNPKGKVLAAFLEKNNCMPDKILFFDDSWAHCKSVNSEMKKLGIPVQCFWCRAAYKEKIKLNKKVIRYQFDYLVEHKEFLSEKEAMEKMELEQKSKAKNVAGQALH